jgi:cell shape-determining protein MreC
MTNLQGDKMEMKNRLLKERTELRERLDKLKSFLDTQEFDSLDRENKSLLCKQELILEQYEKILSRRIVLNT